MPNVFASCDLVVDASWAGTGITGTIREAMAMRKPVIATDCGGNRELVSSPEVGWLIPAKEVAPLARAIAEVIDDRAAPHARGRECARARGARVFEGAADYAARKALHHEITENDAAFRTLLCTLCATNAAEPRSVRTRRTCTSTARSSR